MSYRGARVALDICALGAGESRMFTAPNRDEAALVLLQGEVSLGDEPAHRPSVFEERATAAYIPPAAGITVAAHTPAELAFVTTLGSKLAPGGAVAVVRPAEVVIHQRGEPGWRRAVHDVISETVPARHLLVGETFNEPGEWSSFPPHKHDGSDGEPALEEVYYYRFDRPDGFGFQGLYEANGEARAVMLRHGAIVGIPRGYHPVCAAPGYRLYYLWALVDAERKLAMYEDPAHRWLHTRA